MKGMLRTIWLCVGLMLSSCAYMQTHKNVAEIGSYYEGHILSTRSMELYQYKGQWYLSANQARFKLEYPIVHDSVFRRNDYTPSLVPLHVAPQKVYHAISPSSAAILQRRDGYFQLSTLAEDIRRTPGEWVHSLPNARRHAILAVIDGEQTTHIKGARVPSKPLISSRILSNLDLVFIDAPATAIYNVAIPIMVPFVFFYEFITGE